jgi:hypothetical protein
MTGCWLWVLSGDVIDGLGCKGKYLEGLVNSPSP